MSLDPTISSPDELDAPTSVLPVRGVVVRHRGSSKLIKRHEEPHVGAVVSDEILQQEEVHVPAEVLKQRKEVAVPRQCLAERADLACVAPSRPAESDDTGKGKAGHAGSGIHRHDQLRRADAGRERNG